MDGVISVYMLILSPLWLFFCPGLFLMLAGTIGFITLLPGPLKIGHIGFDVNTLLISSASIICGLQSIMFWITARLFAVQENLLPENSVKRNITLFSLENGLITGGTLFLFGIVLLIIGILYWGKNGFGNIPYGTGLRIIIPSVTLLTIGVQVIFNSFFLSFICSNTFIDRSERGADYK